MKKKPTNPTDDPNLNWVWVFQPTNPKHAIAFVASTQFRLRKTKLGFRGAPRSGYAFVSKNRTCGVRGLFHGVN